MNDAKKTWQEIEAGLKEVDPQKYGEFQRLKKLMKVKNAEVFIPNNQSEYEFKDPYNGRVKLMRTKHVIVAFEGYKEKIDFGCYFSEAAQFWDVDDTILASHTHRECHICRSVGVLEPSYDCIVLNTIHLKYIFEQVKKLEGHRLSFLFK
ncbi:hypothetical protein [Aneurinibacillus tyrosinisolvens]|uniref:hypothetical protein n=1 Tax=Aneurinibacillus tyrosinisolvens TaxID=1443435 RepID=UPI00063F88CC|nr:hypothetical protein [Aneurinibacillus tyrosinisolvens]